MTLEPLLTAAPAIQIHTFAALIALALGMVQFTSRRGSRLHRMSGWTWVLLMAVTAVSSFFIHRIQLVGIWSPIHLLSVFTLVMLWLAIRAAKRGDIPRHRSMMISLFGFALVGAGLFTLLPGRLMHVALFGV